MIEILCDFCKSINYSHKSLFHVERDGSGVVYDGLMAFGEPLVG